MSRGQIFSSDFLFAMILVIFGAGLLFSLFEFRAYDAKENSLSSQFDTKSSSALLTLANSPFFACDLNGISPAFSIDANKISQLSPVSIKHLLGLSDYNVQIAISGISPPVVFDPISSQKIVALDLNIALCINSPSFADLNSCVASSCSSGKIIPSKVSLRVGN